MKVFVSSTFDDLIDYREHVLRALTRCEEVYKGMEFFGSSPRKTLDFCLQQVKASDVVVCLVGHRYGSRPPGSDISFTEHEVNHALELGLPVHAYFIDDEQPIPPRYFDVGPDHAALAAFKQRLAEQVTPAWFTTPPDLAMKIMIDLYGGDYDVREGGQEIQEEAAARHRESAYDSIAEWYDHWYKDHWCNREPFETLRALVSKHSDSTKANPSNIKILDTACGTGNTYVSFKRGGYDIRGCDGSGKMLAKATRNCEGHGIDPSGIVRDPINWTDSEGYEKHFGNAEFDVLLNTANSFCHVPPIAEYMDAALANFRALLKPGGLLIIDTKRCIRAGEIEGVPLYKELRYLAPDWVIRTAREEHCQVPGLDNVRFHTMLHYDVDPAFPVKVPRALIVLTVHGEGLMPQTAVVPYYPLPVEKLGRRMAVAGFATTVYRAMEGPAANWKYDIVVGRKGP
ncbi:MAG: DUF4062 domain-containing protein [Alphaproteobacteria bacterium]|nr:MAG: DUF4062 domain-containing protein [Alphaproteobacteria bacterium]